MRVFVSKIWLQGRARNTGLSTFLAYTSAGVHQPSLQHPASPMLASTLPAAPISLCFPCTPQCCPCPLAVTRPCEASLGLLHPASQLCPRSGSRGLLCEHLLQGLCALAGLWDWVSGIRALQSIMMGPEFWDDSWLCLFLWKRHLHLWCFEAAFPSSEAQPVQDQLWKASVWGNISPQTPSPRSVTCPEGRKSHASLDRAGSGTLPSGNSLATRAVSGPNRNAALFEP